MTCCRYLKYKPCRIPLTESKLSESREPWILVCSQPRLPLPPTQSGQNKFTLKLFFCTELILLKRKTVTFLALTGAQEMRISIRLSWLGLSSKEPKYFVLTLQENFKGYCDWDLLWFYWASLSPTFPSLKCLSVSQNWRPRIVENSVKLPSWIKYLEKYSYFPGYILYVNTFKYTKILIPTWPQLLFGVLTEILAFKYCKKIFFYKSFTVDILY